MISGQQDIEDGAAVCFTVDRDSTLDTSLRVRLQFVTDRPVPHGRVVVDELSSPHFNDRVEEFLFDIDPSGVHRLSMALEGRSGLNWLSLSIPSGEVSQSPCRNYVARRADGEVGRGLGSVNQFEPFWQRDDAEPPSGTVALPSLAVPAGTRVELRLERTLSTRTAYVGESLSARVVKDVSVNGRVLVPEGSLALGEVAESRDAGRFGRSLLTLDFDRIELPDGRALLISSQVETVGPGSGGKQAGIIAGSAIGGALLGKVLGGDDTDALIGAVVGGGIAAGSIGADRNESVVLPAGTSLVIELDSSTSIGDGHERP